MDHNGNQCVFVQQNIHVDQSQRFENFEAKLELEVFQHNVHEEFLQMAYHEH